MISTLTSEQPQKTTVKSPSSDVRENKENKPKKRSNVTTSRTSAHVPPFYFPRGHPKPQGEVEAVLGRLQKEFSALESGKAYKQQMAEITKVSAVLNNFCSIIINGLPHVELHSHCIFAS